MPGGRGLQRLFKSLGTTSRWIENEGLIIGVSGGEEWIACGFSGEAADTELADELLHDYMHGVTW